MPRLKDRLATHFVPFSEFERDAANGTLPDFCLIEPHLHRRARRLPPGAGRALIGRDVDIAIDPPSSILAGEDFLARIYRAIRSADSSEGSNAYNTTFLIGWDEPGGTYDHVPPGPVPPPDPAAPAGECDFTFDRSGYRVPAIIVSPWIDEGQWSTTSTATPPCSPRCARSGTWRPVHRPRRRRPHIRPPALPRDAARPRDLARLPPAAGAGMAADQGPARPGAQPAR